MQKKAKRVIAWGVLSDDHLCRAPEAVCNGRGDAAVYVEYDNDGDMVPSCKKCTPPHSCPDRVSDKFQEIFSRASL